jgi:hypothetical protein
MSTMGRSAEVSRRIWVRRRVPAAATITLALLTAAVVAGLVAAPDGGAPVIFVKRVSSAIGETVTRAGGALWWTHAFVLGSFAAFNPCGSRSFPPKLGLYLADQGGGSGRSHLYAGMGHRDSRRGCDARWGLSMAKSDRGAAAAGGGALSALGIFGALFN